MSPRPTPQVYSWYIPEIARSVERLAKGEYPTEVFKQNYEPGLDDLHLPLMDSYKALSLGEILDQPSLTDWDKYLPHQYFTNGSSEGIFHLLVRHVTYFPHVPLYQFVGEYQGYEQFAKAVGTSIRDVQFGEDLSKLPPGVFLISVPSAVDGNQVSYSVINRLCEDHYVIIDAAYAGMTPQLSHKLSLNPRVAAIVGSMSKPFGLYYYRIGFLWSRDPVQSLYGNRWFKNIFSIQVGETVFGEWDARTLTDKYRPWQDRACNDASKYLGVNVHPSDVWLLGHVRIGTQDIPHSLGPFKRGPGYRLCLTPYYMAYEKE